MLKNKIKNIFFIFISIVIFIILLSYYYSDFLKLFVSNFILTYGYFAVFVVSYLLDLIMQPFAPDLPIFVGISLFLDPFIVVFFAVIASILATITGYYLGLKFGSTGFKKVYGNKRYRDLRIKYNKYAFIVPIAAFSPVPYVPICWISGSLRMNKFKFFIYAVIPRTLRLILVGLVSYFLFISP
jgi:membrane protein YqaA with SNARE-associated domain